MTIVKINLKWIDKKEENLHKVDVGKYFIDMEQIPLIIITIRKLNIFYLNLNYCCFKDTIMKFKKPKSRRKNIYMYVYMYILHIQTHIHIYINKHTHTVSKLYNL